MFREGFGIAWQALVANKMRTILTMLGIIIGVGAVIALVSIGYGVREQVQSSISGLGSNLIMVYPGAGRTPGVRPLASSLESLSVKDYESLTHLPSVEDASPVVRKSFLLVYKNKNWTSSVSGVNERFDEVNNWKLRQGRFLTEGQILRRERVVVIGKTVAKELFGEDTALGKYIRINNHPFLVIGEVESKGVGAFGSDQDDAVFIPYTTAMERLNGVDYVTAIFVSGKSDVDSKRLEADVDNLLRIRHGIDSSKEADFMIVSMDSIMQTVEETTGTLTLFLGAVAAISLLVGGIGIMNIMLVSVTERTREIGIRKALGATYQVIMTQFLIEAVVISLAGGFLGVLTGLAGSALISKLSGLETIVSLPTIALAFGFAMTIGLVFGIYPARKAAKLNPIDALHYE